MAVSPQKTKSKELKASSSSSSPTITPVVPSVPLTHTTPTPLPAKTPSKIPVATKVKPSTTVPSSKKIPSVTKVTKTSSKFSSPKRTTPKVPSVSKIPTPARVKSETNVKSPTAVTLPSAPPESVGAGVSFAERFEIKEKIGSGSFGDVKRGIDKVTGLEVAIKLEKKEKNKVSSVATEAALYRRLELAPCSAADKGIPKMIFSGMDGEHHVLVMEMLGPNLEKLMIKCKRKFTLKTCIQIAIQLIDRIQFIHETRLLHRDIKPENFVIGKLEEKNNRRRNLIHILDFGLSKPYVDAATGKHIPKRTGKELTGTARYVSIRTHDGKEQSRRDDIEAIGHMLIYFMKGSLPWQGLQVKNEDPNLNTKAKNKLRYKLIAETKKKTTIEELCKGLPLEMERYLKYARNELDFIDSPDYDFLRGLFQDLFEAKEFSTDDLYDWDLSDTQLAHLRGSHGLKRSPSNIKIKSGSDIPH